MARTLLLAALSFACWGLLVVGWLRFAAGGSALWSLVFLAGFAGNVGILLVDPIQRFFTDTDRSD